MTQKKNKGNFQNDGDGKSQADKCTISLENKWPTLEQERRGLQKGVDPWGRQEKYYGLSYVFAYTLRGVLWLLES